MIRSQKPLLSKHFSEWPKGWLQKYVSNLLARKDKGAILSGLDNEIMIWLLHKHPKADDKIGIGIKFIFIDENHTWKRKMFILERIDGSRIDFSYKKCLSGKEPSYLQNFCNACRTAVSKDIINFKRIALANNPICRYRGIPLNQENSHVDHVKPKTFVKLVNRFIEEEGIDIKKEIIIGEIQRKFKNKDLEKRFILFHREEAELELVSAEANQSDCK